MRNYQKWLHQLYMESHEEVIGRLEENQKYGDLLTKYTDFQERIDKILFKGNDELKKNIFLQYKEIENKMTIKENEELYFQGYRDCLQFINILMK